MEESIPTKRWIDDTKISIRASLEAAEFIKIHRLWEGTHEYTWVKKAISYVIMAVIGITIFRFGKMILHPSQITTMSVLSIFPTDVLSSLKGSGLNYLYLVLLEVIIFHFTRRSMMLITGEKIDTSFDTFVKAEIRMIKVAFIALGMEFVVKILANVLIGLSSFGFLEEPVGMMIHAFYLGFAIIDNYNELFDMTLKQSHKYTVHYAPIAIITGGILAILLNIPVFGAIVGPIICAVIATLAMYEVGQRDKTKAWIFVEPEKKRKRRNDKKRKS